MAAPPGSRLKPADRRRKPIDRRPDTTVSRPDIPVGGPRAVKVVTREKLGHARVLLSQRIARAPGTSAGPNATKAARTRGTPADPYATKAAQTHGTLTNPYATKAGKAVAFARAQLGKPCVWGAAGPGSYDCAGLTRAAWKSAGVTLPRTAPEQAGVGIPVPPAEARPGDLVFFHDDAGHVGLCTGNGMMIHAPRPGAYVREEPVSALGEAAVHSVVRPG